ncbi:MAG: glucose-6-phosphate isomerase [Bacillota bacterium]
MTVGFDYSKSFIKKHEMQFMEPFLKDAHEMLHDGSGPGNEFIGWLNLTENYDREEYKRLKATAEKIREKADVFIVVGIGGSYLGARAAFEALTHSFHNNLTKNIRKAPQIFFAGNNMSPKYLTDLMDVLEEKEIYVNVISKSGTTTEPAIALRILKAYMEEKYGKEETKNRIIATTDKSKGALKTLANNEGYETFVISDEIGGRYSVLTPVGLLPLAVGGVDIDQIMEGAHEGAIQYSNPYLDENTCYQYAVARQILQRKGKDIEILVNYEPGLQYLGEWWKQLYGESEGKDGKGIFPASVNFTADLHSMGQLIQDGKRNIFETSIILDSSKNDIEITHDDLDLDGLNYLEGKTVGHVNRKAFEGTLLAHLEGNVPNLIISVPVLDEFNFGKLVYFFEKACAISGYLQGVNPFDQPGVEAYKSNMFKLLGKEGY